MTNASPVRRTLLAMLLAPLLATAQTPVASILTPAPVERQDPGLEAAETLIGRPLFLRCFCADNNLAFDAAGHPEQAAKPTDWTLAAVNVQKVERKDSATLELEGVRVAIRFATDRHEFDRHPLNDEKVRILIHDEGSIEHTLDAIFADGLDLRLQRAMPSFWQHYFLPQTSWPADALDGQTIMTPGAPGAPAGITGPRALNHPEPRYTPAANHDHVQGSILLRMVVDASGTARRIAIVQPLGYGLDAFAVENAEKIHFSSGTNAAGQPIAFNILVQQQFAIVAAPH